MTNEHGNAEIIVPAVYVPLPPRQPRDRQAPTDYLGPMISPTLKIASGKDFNKNESFPVQGIQIDNFTNQILRVAGGPQQARIILPYTYGVRLNVYGGDVSISAAISEFTPQYTQAAVIAGEQYAVTLFSRRFVNESAGGSGLRGSVASVADQNSPVGTVITAPNTWSVSSIEVDYLSTATVGNRSLVFTIQNAAGNNIWKIGAGASQAASLTRRYLLTSGVFRDTGFDGSGALLVPIPAGLQLQPGDKFIFTDLAAIDAADSARVVIHGSKEFSLV